jgi:uncharacterized protein (TIGR02246 family)
MMKLLNYTFGAATALALASANASATMDRSPDEAAVKAVTENWRATYATGDFEAISRLYTDDAKLLPPNEVAVSGRKAILVWFEKNLRPLMPGSVTFHDYEIYGGGDTATSMSWMEMYDAKGHVIERGKQTVVLLKQNGQWKIHRDMWSDDTAAKLGK